MQTLCAGQEYLLAAAWSACRRCASMMMAGWVSFSLLTIYTNLGDVHDAMETLAVPYSLVDKRQAADLKVEKGDIIKEDQIIADLVTNNDGITQLQFQIWKNNIKLNPENWIIKK